MEPPLARQQRRIQPGHFQCRAPQQLRRVRIPQASLFDIRQGEKHVHADGRRLRCTAGHWLLVAAGTELDIENHPIDGTYLAESIALPPALLERFRRRNPGLGAGPGAAPCVLAIQPGPDSLRAWRYLRECMTAGAPGALQWQAAENLLLALNLQQAIGPLLRDRHDPLSARIEQHLSLLPPERRTLAQLSHDFHCSAATLRRRLAREHTGFRELLDNIRLGQALDALQSTSRPIADIAADCGYASPSRFAIRFRQRYGLNPSTLRQTR